MIIRKGTVHVELGGLDMPDVVDDQPAIYISVRVTEAIATLVGSRMDPTKLEDVVKYLLHGYMKCDCFVDPCTLDMDVMVNEIIAAVSANEL